MHTKHLHSVWPQESQMYDVQKTGIEDLPLSAPSTPSPSSGRGRWKRCPTCLAPWFPVGDGPVLWTSLIVRHPHCHKQQGTTIKNVSAWGLCFFKIWSVLMLQLKLYWIPGQAFQNIIWQACFSFFFLILRF